FDRGRALEQMEQQRSGDVVRQVADDTQPAAALTREARKIEVERIGFVKGDSGIARELIAQHGRKVPIDLDEVERSAPCRAVSNAGPVFEQRVRQGAATGADLDEVIRRPG